MLRDLPCRIEQYEETPIRFGNNYEKKGTFVVENERKKGTLKIQKSYIVILVLNQSPISTIFAIVRFPGSTKLVLSGDPLY